MVKKELFAEATFYQIQGLISQLDWKTLKSSTVINNENYRSSVMTWLPPRATCSLLYRATTDGKTPEDFHRCCDNKGPTLVVMKSEKNIFGGYTSKSWESRMLSTLALLTQQ